MTYVRDPVQVHAGDGVMLTLYRLRDAKRRNEAKPTVEFTDGEQARFPVGSVSLIAEQLLAGVNATKIAAKLGLRRQAVSALLRRIDARRAEFGLSPLPCPCGKPLAHRGRCQGRA